MKVICINDNWVFEPDTINAFKPVCGEPYIVREAHERGGLTYYLLVEAPGDIAYLSSFFAPTSEIDEANFEREYRRDPVYAWKDVILSMGGVPLDIKPMHWNCRCEIDGKAMASQIAKAFAGMSSAIKAVAVAARSLGATLNKTYFKDHNYREIQRSLRNTRRHELRTLKLSFTK